MFLNLQFNAVHAHSRKEIELLIHEKSAAAAGVVAVADLSLGSWTPNALATQLLSQITGKELRLRGAAQTVSSDLGEAMSAGIDQEGRGNRSVLDAAGMSAQIVHALRARPMPLLVLVPRYGIPWRMEDKLLIEYLQRGMRSLDLTFVVSASEFTPWPEHWTVHLTGLSVEGVLPGQPTLASLLPATLSPSVLKSFSAADLECVISLPNGWAVVSPETRRNPATPNGRLGDIKIHDYLAYAALHSENTVEPWIFGAEAWKHFSSGYRDLALLYIASAESAAQGASEKSIFQCHKQAMRVALALYKEASSEPDPDPTLPNAAQGFLMETKGWGYVMSGNAQPAIPLLRRALEICRPAVVDAAYLFLMNITALSEVRCGNYAGAFDLEIEINKLISELAVPNYRLVFVNSINLARLHRYSGDLDQAECWYGRAFATVDGARTEIDGINSNLCLARVHEGRKDYQGSFLCWLRAAFHWSASECPEALNWRVQNLILGKGGLITVNSLAEGFSMVERISTALLENLKKYSALAGIEFEPDSKNQKRCRFEYAGVKVPATPLRYVGGAGWAVMASESVKQPREYGLEYSDLNRWLAGWIASSCGRENENAYLLDLRDGLEVPANWSDVLTSAIDFSVLDITYDGRNTQLTVEQFTQLENLRECEVSSMVARAEKTGSNTTVYFKRYLQPYVLTAEERAVFEVISQERNLSAARLRTAAIDVNAANKWEQVILQLRKARVLKVSRTVEAAKLSHLAISEAHQLV